MYPRAKPTSYTLRLVRVNFRFLFKLLSAGIRWPQYSEVGCISLKRFLLFSCKKAHERRTHEFGMGKNTEKSKHFALEKYWCIQGWPYLPVVIFYFLSSYTP